MQAWPSALTAGNTVNDPTAEAAGVHTQEVLRRKQTAVCATQDKVAQRYCHCSTNKHIRNVSGSLAPVRCVLKQGCVGCRRYSCITTSVSLGGSLSPALIPAVSEGSAVRLLAQRDLLDMCTEGLAEQLACCGQAAEACLLQVRTGAVVPVPCLRARPPCLLLKAKVPKYRSPCTYLPRCHSCL